MRILVLATDYSDNTGRLSSHYIHTRNVEYLSKGIDVTVLNFRSQSEYQLDDVRVIPLSTFETELIEYDMVVSHAPNLRNHYRFFNKHQDQIKKLIIFFHGHEVLRLSEAYPAPYDFIKRRSQWRVFLRDIYDTLKFRVWRRFFIRNTEKLTLVFVSHWMLDMFKKNVKIPNNKMPDHHIIYNSAGRYFEINQYKPNDRQYDFITIRNNLDGSKYSIDIVEKLAKLYPDYKFLIIGTGKYFDINPLPENVTLIKKQLQHEEMGEYLNKSKFALMPTRTDSQGVMSSEFMTYGIPLITSSIPVCVEIFGEENNVWLIDNESIDGHSLDFITQLNEIQIEPSTKFYRENTVYHEIDLFEKIYHQ